MPPTSLRLGGLEMGRGYFGGWKAMPECSALEWSTEPAAEWGALLEIGRGKRERSFMRRDSMSWQRGTMWSRDSDQMMRVRSSR
jgi:hypothetical protein